MPAHTLHGSTDTLPMDVRNTGFLLDRLGEDCHPIQYLRELTTNAIEAIQKTPDKTGEIIWDVDWTTFQNEGLYKLSILDTGVGMTAEEMERYINNLSSSGDQQTITGNYGVGAKISAATRNHCGVIYASWKNGEGSLIHLWRNPETGTYGLRRFASPTGQYTYSIGLANDVRPDPIRDHGTKVVLLGNDPNQNTVAPPRQDIPSPSRWVSKYLNTRYFKFPANITVKAREGWEFDQSDKDRNLLRTITGQESYLQNHSASSGVVKLINADVHWWILRDEPAIKNNSGFIESAGHVAGLYKGELYEMALGRAGMALLQNFGIVFGYRFVVLYVAPRSDAESRVTTNTARTQLLVNNSPLPWADWAAEFRENMPREIRALVDEKAATLSSGDHTKSIRERLKNFLDLYKLSRYRAVSGGDLRVDEQNVSVGGQPGRQQPGIREGDVGGVTGTPGGKAGGAYSIYQKDDGAPGKRVQPDPFPMTRWISVRDGSREIGDLEDRAAKYLADQNLLLINADFRAFTDMVNRLVKERGGNSANLRTIEDAVRSWFEQALVETVIGLQQLRNAKEWTPKDIEAALSPEALTAAVMPRYHVLVSVNRELGTKLGKLEGAAAS